ncbi:hypothetical protein BH09MYX1_BH09MYX1_58560 [soil metagenome]
MAALTAQLLTAQPAFADPSSTSVQQGYEQGDIQSPRTMAMANAQTALGTSTSALVGNPANLPFARVYHFETLAFYQPEARRQSYGGAVADSVTNKLAGGFAGTWNSMDPDGIDRTWTDLRLSIAYPLTNWLALGLTGRYLRMSQAVSKGPFGQSIVSDGSSDQALASIFTFNAGLTIQPVKGLSFGVVASNLTHPGTGIAPTTIAIGAGFTNEVISVEADSQIDFDTWGTPRSRWGVGGELFLVNHLLLRLGYRFDTGMKTHALSTGVGYVDRRFSVELSGRRDIIADNPATSFVIGLRYFYDTGVQVDQAMGAD